MVAPSTAFPAVRTATQRAAVTADTDNANGITRTHHAIAGAIVANATGYGDTVLHGIIAVFLPGTLLVQEPIAMTIRGTAAYTACNCNEIVVVDHGGSDGWPAAEKGVKSSLGLAAAAASAALGVSACRGSRIPAGGTGDTACCGSGSGWKSAGNALVGCDVSVGADVGGAASAAALGVSAGCAAAN